MFAVLSTSSTAQAAIAAPREQLRRKRFSPSSRIGERMQISHLWINVVGVAGASCSMVSFIPQALKIIKERDASSVSLRMYIVTVCGFCLWTIYGVLLKSWPLIGSNIISLMLSGWILCLKIWLPSQDERP
jgi:MtN3 and saliva related transmembrane protein